MRRQIPILFVSLVVLLFASSAIFAADTPHQNASGKWKLNLQKSDFGNTPAPKSADLTVAETGDKLTWSYSGTTAEGKSEQLTFDGLITWRLRCELVERRILAIASGSTPLAQPLRSDLGEWQAFPILPSVALWRPAVPRILLCDASP